jgi:Sortase domain
VYRPVVQRADAPGPRLPPSVLNRRPAEVVPPPPPARPRFSTVRPRAAAVPPAPHAPAPHAPAPHAPAPNAPAPRRRRFRRPAAAPRPRRGRRSLPVGALAVALVFAGLFAVGMGFGVASGFDLADWFRGPGRPPPRAFPVLEPSRPVRLTIPAIGVQAPVMAVGLAADGSVGVPPVDRHNEAAWFDAGPTPGQYGPAVIVGHVDTKVGPSVFHDLDRMRPGQKIEVLRRDATVAVFRVTSVEHFGKNAVPAARVYGDYSRPALRLMTCGGTWLGGRQGYSDNIVVFAALAGSRRA